MIAEKFGTDAVRDTYNRAMKAWKKNYIYLTELVIVLNWNIWYWDGAGTKKAEALTELYISGIAMLAIAIFGFVAITYFVGFDLASMVAAVLMCFIGWAIAFPEDSAEYDDDDYDYYEE